MPGEAAHVGLVDDQVPHRQAQRPVALPVKIRGRLRQAAGSLRPCARQAQRAAAPICHILQGHSGFADSPAARIVRMHAPGAGPERRLPGPSRCDQGMLELLVCATSGKQGSGWGLTAATGGFSCLTGPSWPKCRRPTMAVAYGSSSTACSWSTPPHHSDGRLPLAHWSRPDAAQTTGSLCKERAAALGTSILLYFTLAAYKGHQNKLLAKCAAHDSVHQCRSLQRTI